MSAPRRPKTIVLTGGAGFIGSHIAHRFASEGVEVHVIDNLVDGSRANLTPSAFLHRCDCDSEQALAVVRGVAPAALLHFAADASAGRNPEANRAANDRVTSGRLFERVAKANSRIMFLFASTVAVLDGGGELSAYAAGKLATERALTCIARSARSRHVSLRFANVYGPRQNGSSMRAVIPTFCRAILAGRPLVIHGDGSQTRDFIHVDDVAEAVWRVVTSSGAAEGPLVVSSGRATSVLDVARLLCAASAATTSLEFRPAAATDGTHSRPDGSATMQLLSWRPAVGLEDGLARTLAWHRDLLAYHAPGDARDSETAGPVPALPAPHDDRLATHDSRPVHQRQTLADLPGV